MLILTEMITLKDGSLFYITATRFNNETWEQNKRYREKYNFKGCIYGVPKLMPQSILKESKIYVFEMNNSKPCKIMGLGILYNKIRIDKKYIIYNDMNYNRYTYIGKHRIDREKLNKNELEKMEKVENIVFKGKGHIKRGFGISCFSLKQIQIHKNFLRDFVLELERKYIYEDERNINTQRETI